LARKKHKNLNKKKRSTHKSVGMATTQERLELMNKESKNKMSISIVDLYDNDEPCGTKIEIIVPVYYS